MTTTPTSPTPRPARPSLPTADRLADLFADGSGPARPWWRRRRAAVLAVVALVVVSTVLATQAFGSSSPGYRTATVATRDVDALVTGVATIEPVSQAAVAFPASGTVASIDVALGSSVAVGQSLATLDPASVLATLHDKQAALAQAELVLQKALAGESVGATGGSGGTGRDSSGTGPTARTSARRTAPSTGIVLTAARTGGSDPDLVAAQQAVLSGQQRVDTALTTAQAALDAATTVCAAAGVDPSGTPATTPTTSPTAAQLTACQAAAKDVLIAQTAVSGAQRSLADASTALDALLTRRADAAASSPAADAGSTDVPTDGSGPTTGATATSPAAASPSSADLVSYQKAVDAAAAEVAAAEQGVAQTTITSPIAGTVVGVNLAVGDPVTGASTTQNVVVVGPGGYEAVITVPVTDVTHVKVGQRATLVPDGSSRALDATVTSIGASPESGSSTTSYQVVVGLSPAAAAGAAARDLHNGATGSVAIVTDRATSALAVPTSAVTTAGTRHRVTVLDGSTTEVVSVDVGVVGTTWTQVTGGLRSGQQVVLADLAEPLPGSATDTATNGADSGRFPGGDVRRGAFPGGGTFLPGGPPGA